MGDDVSARRARHVGWSIIAGSWACAGYLLAYYAVLLWFGPDRLHRTLGDGFYNSLFPNGGFVLVLTALLLAAIWAVPLGLLSGLSAMVLRLVASGIGGGRTLVVSAIGGIALTLALHCGSLDGWPATVFPYLLRDDTEFAPTYSVVGFWRVRPGMRPERVLALVGEPLERYAIAGHADEEGWRWSRSPHSSDYRVRVVRFRDGEVVERFAEYYFD